jgi:hypothetical protein
MKRVHLFLIILILLILQGCKDSSNPVNTNNSYIYPLFTGNKWYYSYITKYSNIRPDSLDYMFNEETIASEAEVTRETTVGDEKVYEIMETNKFGVSHRYYANKPDGFFIYAYKERAAIVLPKNNLKYKFDNRVFSSVRDVINYCINAINSNDSLQLIYPPSLVYSSDMKTGNKWNYQIDYFKIQKVVAGTEVVFTGDTYHLCYDISWIYNSLLDVDIHEFISPNGLIKKIIRVKDVIITGPDNPQGIGYVDIEHEIILASTSF